MARQNNFDVMRLMLALLVLGQHLRDLTGVPVIEQWFGWFSGLFAIHGFFVISGFLIVQSYERSRSIKEYTEKRFRRVYPGYAVSVVVFFLLCGATSELPMAEVFLSWEALKFILANLSFMNFIQDSLPGVFVGQRYNEINGALWTIKVEVMFYAVVPIISRLVRLFGSHWVFAVMFVCSCLYRWFFTIVYPNDVLNRQLPGQMTYFCVGGWLYYNRNWFMRLPIWVAGFAVLGVVGVQYFGEVTIRPVVIGLLVMFCSLRLRYLGNWCRYGDLSYGVYIVHFPIIQLLVHFGFYSSSPASACVLTVLGVLCASLMSWHFVEKRFLLKSSHYLGGSVPQVS